MYRFFLVIVLLAIIVPIGKVAHPIDDYYAFAPPSWDHLFGIGNENEDYWTIPAAMIIIISLLFYYIAHSLSVALNVKNHS
jgi:ABC-type dipeptide/oligopeptide/nickel transport system permease subunit